MGDEGVLVVAVADPFDSEPLDDLRSSLRRRRDRARVLASESGDPRPPSTRPTTAAHLDRPARRGSHATTSTHWRPRSSSEPQDLLEATDDAPIIRLVNSLLQHAVKERASDIHIEPFETEIRVRFRIDDVLYEPMKARCPSASRQHRLAHQDHGRKLDIAEKRLPQDGRIRLKIAGRDYDVRLSTCRSPTASASCCACCPTPQDLLDLEKIGFSATSSTAPRAHDQAPNGIILVTGPDRLGQDDDALRGLAEINRPTRTSSRSKTPVEIQLPGIGQIEVNPKIGLTFARPVCAPILRQDPNVVLVGEIRDKETAEIAIQASLTGHLVLSTLHTNDARQRHHPARRYGRRALPGRLLAGRRPRPAPGAGALPEHCREKYVAERTAKPCSEIGVRASRPDRARRRSTADVGCGEMQRRPAIVGRLGIFELMIVDDDIRCARDAKNIDAKTIKQRRRCRREWARFAAGRRAQGARGHHLGSGGAPRHRRGGAVASNLSPQVVDGNVPSLSCQGGVYSYPRAT